MKTINYKNYIIEVHENIHDYDPRGDDNLGTMICFHNKYNLGDLHKLKSTDFNGWKELESYIKRTLRGFVIIPLYLYDHSGITMNTNGFSCTWDSGQVGYIYTTIEKIQNIYNIKRISKKFKETIREYLIDEVKEYDDFLTESKILYTCIIRKENNTNSITVIGNNTEYNTEIDCINSAKQYIETL